MKLCGICIGAGLERDCAREGRCLDSVEGLPPEDWRPVPGAEIIMEASSLGRVRTKRCRKGRNLHMVHREVTSDGLVLINRLQQTDHPDLRWEPLADVLRATWPEKYP